MSETIITKDLCDKMVRLRNQAEYFDLVGVELLREMTVTEMAQVCNGIGASMMNEDYRRALDRLFPELVVDSGVHDAMFSFMPDEAFHWVNQVFKENGYKIAAQYGWLRPRRYCVRLSARGFSRICDTQVGALAWTQAHEEARRIFDPDRLKHLQKIAIEIWEKHR